MSLTTALETYLQLSDLYVTDILHNTSDALNMIV
jgi:hypothetical protein